MFMDLARFSALARTSCIAITLALSGGALSGCDLTRNQLKTDRAGHMEFQDYRDAMATRLPLQEEQAAAMDDDEGIPALKSYVAQPSENLRPMPLVSISVNQTVPLKDVLFELAKQAEYDVELDPRIRGAIIFTARNRPFDVVVKRIADIAGLRYSFEDDILRVELDKPYSKTYKIDYLNYVRSTSSSIRNDIAVVTGSGTNTGSGFQAASESESDFWAELTANLEQILGVKVARGTLLTEEDPQVTVVEQNPAPVEPTVVETEGEDGEIEATVEVQPPEAVLQVNALPPTTNQNNNSGNRDEDEDAASFSVNRQGGIISVNASERQHKEVAEYLKILKRAVTSQVLIEAKVLEVSLTDEYNTGIDWSEFSLSGKAAVDILLPQQNFFEGGAAGGIGTTLTVGGNEVNAVISALSQFGTVRALASPRLTVLNNQSAALNVAQNLVYFEIDIETTDTETGTRTEVDSEIRNVPEGVLINVQPSINLDDRTIAMAIRPTITNVEEFESDPGVELQAAAVGADITSDVPIVQVQEFDSVISMNSGQAVIMGGLMQDRQRTSQQAVPIISDLPLLGNAFRSHVDEISKTELIVFLKATIIEGTNIHNTDRELYRMFSSDRRPLDL